MGCWAAPFRVPLVYPTLQKNERIAVPGVRQIRFQLFLSRAHPRCVMLLCDSRFGDLAKSRLVRWALQQEAIQQRMCRGSGAHVRSGTFARLAVPSVLFHVVESTCNPLTVTEVAPESCGILLLTRSEILALTDNEVLSEALPT
jgi:hypothetical protein